MSILNKFWKRTAEGEDASIGPDFDPGVLPKEPFDSSKCPLCGDDMWIENPGDPASVCEKCEGKDSPLSVLREIRGMEMEQIAKIIFDLREGLSRAQYELMET